MTQHSPHHQHDGGRLGIQQNKSPAGMLVILIGGMVVIAGAVVVVVMMNRGGSPGTPPPQQAATTPAPAPAPVSNEPKLPPAAKVPPKVDITTAAEDLIEKYTVADRAATTGGEAEKAKLTALMEGHQGKVIEVTGRVFGKSDSELVGYSISLEGGVEKTRGVRCELATENKPQLAAIARGQTVVIRGTWTGFSSDIDLKDCAVMAIKSEE